MDERRNGARRLAAIDSLNVIPFLLGIGGA